MSVVVHTRECFPAEALTAFERHIGAPIPEVDHEHCLFANVGNRAENPDTGAFGNRKCTARYKIEVVARELAKRGATPAEPAVVGLGISTDEIERARSGVAKDQPWTTRTNPLLDLGLSRIDCEWVIHDAGLPVPPKSSCWFCPFQSAAAWQRRRRRQPDLFAKAERLEDTINVRRAELGRDRVGLASAAHPLGQAIADQLVLDGMDGCDSRWCMT